MGRDRKPEIARFASSLDLVFMLTGLNGICGRAVSSVAAKALHEMGIFTVAVLPGRREADAVRSLSQIANAVFEIPYEPFWHMAHTPQSWQKHSSAEIARICRLATYSFARRGHKGIDANELIPVLLRNRVSRF
jgi:lysophospholipase L1-like esterase